MIRILVRNDTNPRALGASRERDLRGPSRASCIDDPDHVRRLTTTYEPPVTDEHDAMIHDRDS